MKVNQRVALKPSLKDNFPTFLSDVPVGKVGIVDAIKWASGVEIALVTFETGVTKKLPAVFLAVLESNQKQ